MMIVMEEFPSASKLLLLAPITRAVNRHPQQRKRDLSSSNLLAQQQDDDSNGGIWLPQLRRVMGSVATLGALEMGYLTYQKVVLGDSSVLCGLL